MTDAVMAYFVAGCFLACLLIVLGETAMEFWEDVQEDRRDFEQWLRIHLPHSESEAQWEES